MLPAGIALLIWSRRFPQRGEWAKLIVTGILNIGAFQALLFIAAYRLPGGLAAVIGAIQPLLVMLLAWWRRPAALALAGGVLRHRRHTRYGHAAAVAAHRPRPAGHRRGVSRGDQYGAGHLALPALGALLPIVALTGWQLTIGGVVLAPVALIVDPPLHQVTVLQAAGYLWLCLAGAMLAYGLWFRGDWPPLTGGRVGDESAEPGDRRGTGMDIPRTKIQGMALMGLIVVLASVMSIQRALARQAAGAKRKKPRNGARRLLRAGWAAGARPATRRGSLSGSSLCNHSLI